MAVLRRAQGSALLVWAVVLLTIGLCVAGDRDGDGLERSTADSTENVERDSERSTERERVGEEKRGRERKGSDDEWSAKFFALAVMPGTGHHQRMSSIAFELYRRGHQVLYMSTDYLEPKFLADFEHFHTMHPSHTLPSTSQIEFFSFGSSDDMITENERRRDLSELSGVAPGEWHRYMQTGMVEKLKERLPDLLVVDAMAVVGFDARIEFDLKIVAVHPTTIQMPLQQSWHFPSLTHPLAWEESSNIVGHIMTVAFAYLNHNTWRAHTRDFNAVKLLTGSGLYEKDPIHNFWFDVPNFVFSLPSLALNQPLPEYSVHYVGLPHHRGLAEQELDAELLAWIEADSRPVVYVAFGTVALPEQAHVQPLERGLRDNRWKVVWAMRPSVSRYFEESGTDTWRSAQNFLVRDWVPQPQLLRHPQVELFVTHGGCNSISEAVAAGTPMICVPYLGDQPSNCFRAAEAGVAMRMIEGDQQPWDGSGYSRMVSRALGMTEPEADPHISDFFRRKSQAKETQRALKKAATEMKLLAESYGRSDIRSADLLEFFVEFEDQRSLMDHSSSIAEGNRLAFDLLAVGFITAIVVAVAGTAVVMCCRCCCCRRRSASVTSTDVAVAVPSKKKKKKRKTSSNEK